jgi:predicted GNAT superfamily acetyltransferase
MTATPSVPDGTPRIGLRDAMPQDFRAILALNAESVHFLSPLNPARLADLHAQAAYHRVLECDGAVAAFLLAFREGADYDSPNYRWFVEHCGQFLYIDRVVVAHAQQGRGLGAMLYDDIIAFAAMTGVAQLTCEFDLDPPNPGSARFHARYGFREVGQQWIGGGKKQVSLQAREVRVATVRSPV